MLWRFVLSLLLIVSICAALSAGPATNPTINPVDENGRAARRRRPQRSCSRARRFDW
jgi:hypothetical protein